MTKPNEVKRAALEVTRRKRLTAKESSMTQKERKERYAQRAMWAFIMSMGKP